MDTVGAQIVLTAMEAIVELLNYASWKTQKDLLGARTRSGPAAKVLGKKFGIPFWRRV